MIVLPHEHGSVEWIQARLGIPTASEFDRLLTPGGKISTATKGYLHEKLAEYFIGEPVNQARSPYMDRGTAIEADAIAWYAFDHDVEVQPGRFCLRDDGRCGASPDGFVGDSGLVEAKAFGIVNHIGRLLSDASDYRAQVQGQLYVTGREWCDRVSFNPVLPSHVVRVYRDEKFIETLATAIDCFIEDFDAAVATLTAMGATRLGQRCEHGVTASICRHETCVAKREGAS